MPRASTQHVTFDLPTVELDRILSNAEWMLRDGMDHEEVQRWARQRVAKRLTVCQRAAAGGRGGEIFSAASA